MASRAAPTGVATLAGYRFSFDSGAKWNESSFYNAVQIEATAVAAIPEPQTLAMMLAGLVVVGGIVSRRKAKQSQYM